MKQIFFLLAAMMVLFTSCEKPCEKTLQGTILDKITNEPISNAKVILTGAEETGSIGRQFYTLDPVLTDENGQFAASITEDIYLWNYTVEAEGFVGPNEINRGTIYDVSCGNQVVEITMQGIAYVDIRTFDDTAKLGNRVHFYTEYPTLESTGIIDLGETFRIPVLEGEAFEIELVVYNTFDEMLSEETITVELGKGEVQEIEIGI